ncbi:MAG TPA: DUF5916 domain-containing protein [Acidobacteriota bacterium]|nr:DUF5916 domain-containing protein [Acidobacteriota bacterium]
MVPPHLIRHLSIIGTLLFLPSGVQAQIPKLKIPRVSTPPKLEDFVNGKLPDQGVKVTDFRQREPGDGKPVSRDTAAYLSYDDKNLYIVFVCKEEAGKVRARLAKREDIFFDDVVGIILDTFHDRRRAYMFFCNPLGIQADGITTEGQNDDFSFDTLWYSEGRLTPEGYIVWMAIPFKSLRFTHDPAQTWGIALGRFILRNLENSFWPYITRSKQGFVQQMATLEGLEQISPGRNMQLIPYGVFAGSRFLDAQTPGFRTDIETRGGLDAKMILHDALAVDVALNPDFSQVESDEPQVTVNQRFEVFFPEKRPFFIENAGFFQTPEQLFFSRRIVNPQFGARLTGKVGNWALGGLVIDDRAPGKGVPDDDPLRGRRAGIGMLRVQREFGEQSHVGLLVTSRDFASSSNRIFSLDTRLKMKANWTVTGQAIASETRELDGSRLAGPAYLARISHEGKHFNYSTTYSDRSPGFRSQLGFIPRSDIRQIENSGNYQWRPEKSRVLSFGPFFNTLVNWNRRGRLQDWQAFSGLNANFKGASGLAVFRSESFELFQDHGFRKKSSGAFFITEWSKWLGLNASYEKGASVNYYPAAGLDPFLANSLDTRLTLRFHPSSQANLEQTYIYSRLAADRKPIAQVPASASIFNNHILRWKLNYQFTRALSLRGICDYNSVLPNAALVNLERQKRFTADILATYLLNPGTALYIGYTDGYQNLAIDPGVPPALRRTQSPFNSTGRQVFVKFSYLFRF